MSLTELCEVCGVSSSRWVRLEQRAVRCAPDTANIDWLPLIICDCHWLATGTVECGIDVSRRTRMR